MTAGDCEEREGGRDIILMMHGTFVTISPVLVEMCFDVRNSQAKAMPITHAPCLVSRCAHQLFTKMHPHKIISITYAFVNMCGSFTSEHSGCNHRFSDTQ